MYRTAVTKTVTCYRSIFDSVDADGVTFAANHDFSQKLDERDDSIDKETARREDLHAENEQLRERSEEPEAWMIAIEDHLGIETGSY